MHPSSCPLPATSFLPVHCESGQRPSTPPPRPHHCLQSTFCTPPSQERPMTLVCATYPVRAPMTAGSRSTGRTSVHLCAPLLSPHKWTEGAPVFVDWRPTARSQATSFSGRVTAAPQGASQEKTRGGDHGLILYSRSTVVHLLCAMQSSF